MADTINMINLSNSWNSTDKIDDLTPTQKANKSIKHDHSTSDHKTSDITTQIYRQIYQPIMWIHLEMQNKIKQ